MKQQNLQKRKNSSCWSISLFFCLNSPLSRSSPLTISPSPLRTCQRTAGSSCWWRRASISSRPTRMSSPLARATSSAWLVRRTAAGGKERSMAGPGGSLATTSVRSKAPVGVGYLVILPLRHHLWMRPPLLSVSSTTQNNFLNRCFHICGRQKLPTAALHHIVPAAPSGLVAATQPREFMWWELAVPNPNT